MVFSSLFFIYLFFVVFLICYFASKNSKNKNTILIIFSLLFYAWGEPVYLWLLILSTLINYLCGRVIDYFRDKPLSKICFALSLVYNIGMLMIFKYSGFIVENLNSWFSLKSWYFASDWYQFLHFSGHVLYNRLLLGYCKSSEELF